MLKCVCVYWSWSWKVETISHSIQISTVMIKQQRQRCIDAFLLIALSFGKYINDVHARCCRCIACVYVNSELHVKPVKALRDPYSKDCSGCAWHTIMLVLRGWCRSSSSGSGVWEMKDADKCRHCCYRRQRSQITVFTAHCAMSPMIHDEIWAPTVPTVPSHSPADHSLSGAYDATLWQPRN